MSFVQIVCCLVGFERSYTLCCGHGSAKFFCLGLLIMNYESFLCVQSEFMLKTIPAGYSLLVIFQIYFFTTIKMTRKASISSISAQIVSFLSLPPYPKPSFYIVINPNNNISTQKVKMQLLDNRYISHG